MMIKLEHVNKYFGTNHVLKDVNLEVKEGEKLVIIGPSGSGKSTTVRCMNFLEEPTDGHVYINGTELTRKNRTQIIRDNMSMVFQQFNLYPHMTVLQNLTLAPMKLKHKSKEDAEKTAYHYLEVVGLRHKANVYPTTLSGGQQQRIAIARVMLKNTPVIILDEATAFADPDNETRVQAAFSKLSQGKTVIMIAHRLSTVAGADRIYVVKDGQIAESGSSRELMERGGLFARMWQNYQTSIQWKVQKEVQSDDQTSAKTICLVRTGRKGFN